MLKIHHRTAYRYRQPVSLGSHRLMLRPRESRDPRLISSDVTVTPAATMTWAQDVFGNAVATATFQSIAARDHRKCTAVFIQDAQSFSSKVHTHFHESAHSRSGSAGAREG